VLASCLRGRGLLLVGELSPRVAAEDVEDWGMDCRGFELTLAEPLQIPYSSRSCFSPLSNYVIWFVA
jgi:hypothetical protein